MVEEAQPIALQCAPEMECPDRSLGFFAVDMTDQEICLKLPQNVQRKGKAAISSHRATRLNERTLKNLIGVRAVLVMIVVS